MYNRNIQHNTINETLQSGGLLATSLLAGYINAIESIDRLIED